MNPICCLAALCFGAVAAQTPTNAWTHRPTSPQPDRSYPFMVHEGHTDRIVRFGGWNGSGGTSETWAFDGVDWAELTTATAPPPRAFHGQVVYDSARQRIVMFGGSLRPSATPHADTWEFDGTDWHDRTPADSPGARWHHSLAYDAARGVVVMFGGLGSAGGTTVRRDTWEWDGLEWTRRGSTNRPAARFGHMIAYDAARERTVLFGGLDRNSVALTDTWEWDGNEWTRITPATSPHGVYLGGFVYHAARQKCYLFGGENGSTGAWSRNVWSWDGVTWQLENPAGGPTARCCPGMAYDPTRESILMFGGCDNFVINDTWELHDAGLAAHREIGLGCPGVAGVPDLTIEGDAWAGESVTYRAETGAAGAAWLLIGTPGVLDLGWIGMPGCVLSVSPFATLQMTSDGSSAMFTLAIPRRSSLIGTGYSVQALVRDAGANLLGFVLSPAVAATIGAR